MVLSSAIVFDHDRRIADDRRPYCDPRSAICDPRSYGNQPLSFIILPTAEQSFELSFTVHVHYFPRVLLPILLHFRKFDSSLKQSNKRLATHCVVGINSDKFFLHTFL